MDGARRVELGELGHLRAHVERLQRRQRAPERLEQIALVLRVRKRRIYILRCGGKGVCDMWEKWVSGWRNEIPGGLGGPA